MFGTKMGTMKDIPTAGYIIPNESSNSYRATALAWMIRENVLAVEHRNGEWYNQAQLKGAIINYSK
jgi:hypothetical protein